MPPTFDYIIIGAGSAGCLLANRLSANGRRVLLLEAGPEDRHPNVKIPAAFSKLFRSKYDWDYRTPEQPAMANRRLYQPRGKLWGGSSSINAMIYIRGNRQDYDDWSAMGCAGWSYEEVLPYFKKHENNHVHRDASHGQAGELHVNDQRSLHPLSQIFLQAAQQAGYTLNPDFNGDIQEGVGAYQVNQHRGRRWSAADAFLRPALQARPNLSVESNALAEKLLFTAGREVNGVRYLQRGVSKKAIAQREVILCAGAYNSPQLLLLSGIGPAEELREWNIPVHHHLPGVGRNLQDHLICGISYRTAFSPTLDSSGRFPGILGATWQFLSGRKGPLTSIVAEAGGFVKSDPALPAPDLQFNFAPSYFIRHGFDNPKTGRGFSAGNTLLQPYSRGSVRLTGRDVRDPLHIDPRYFSDERDARTLLRGVQMAEEIVQQNAFSPWRTERVLPDRDGLSEEEMMQLVREYAQTLYHPTSTCKMGTDEQAVVDPELRVHGIGGLRIADASIMPKVIRGNTNAPVYMIAEKAAEMIMNNTEAN